MTVAQNRKGAGRCTADDLSFTRRRLIAIIAVGMMTATHAGLSNAAPKQRPSNAPNIVLILADDMGYGDASCYPDSWLSTPNLDRMAGEGMRLSDFHSSCPVCSPTRAGLLTGRYQQRAGIPGVIFADEKQNRHHGLFPHEVTLADLLKEAGYATAVFGKWHLGYQRRFNPIHNGFDHFRGYVSGNIDFISHVDRMGIADWWNGGKLSPEEGYVTHLITRHAVRFIEQNKDRPFFLYIAHEAVHSPYQGPQDKPVRAVGRGNIKGAARKDIKAAYREMMTEMDRGVGEVLAALKKHGIDDDTFVFFCSDNGANRNGSNGKLRGFKGSLWEGGHRVPAIARWPGRISPGTVSDETLISIDVLPTVLELTGRKPSASHKLDGVSFASVLFGNKSLTERTLFWDYNGKQAVRRGPWKLVVGERGLPSKFALFNLDDDRSEKQDVAAKQPEQVARMRAALKSWQKDVAANATPQPKR